MDSVQDQTCDSGASDDNVAALGGNVEARLSRLEAQLTGTAESVNTILALLQKGQVRNATLLHVFAGSQGNAY